MYGRKPILLCRLLRWIFTYIVSWISEDSLLKKTLLVINFVLDEADMTAIQALNEGENRFFSHYDPATIEMMTGLQR